MTPATGKKAQRSMRDRLRLPAEGAALTDIPTDGTPGAPGGKRKTVAAMEAAHADLAELQERLYADGATGGRRRVLLVLQGMDTAGKDGVIRHTIGMLNPQGCTITSFKAPTEEELRHNYLWRIRRAVPEPGMVGVFNRSHYEDVLVVRVHDLVPPEQWMKRYDEINRFERQLVDTGVVIVKCFLHISFDEQRERLLSRLDDPSKRWKFNAGDVAERRRWADYQSAYVDALHRCSDEVAPWYVVPSDRKWYRNYAVAQLLQETLADFDLGYPKVRFNVEAQKRKLQPPH